MNDDPEKPALPVVPDDAPRQAPAPRRDFLDGALISGAVLLGGSAVYPIARYVNAPVVADTQALEVVVGKENTIQTGTAVGFRFGSKPAIVARDAGGKLHAF